MSTGNRDLTPYTEGPFGNVGTKRYTVQAGAAASINPGEPVAVQVGSSGTVVAALATNKPLVGTDWLVGVSQSLSTDTTTAKGVVDVYDIFAQGSTWLVAPKVAATWATQALYNALVGSRVLLDLTTGVYTVLATDAFTIAAGKNGCIVEPLDISKYPGKVRISFNRNLDFKAQS